MAVFLGGTALAGIAGYESGKATTEGERRSGRTTIRAQRRRGIR